MSLSPLYEYDLSPLPCFPVSALSVMRVFDKEFSFSMIFHNKYQLYLFIKIHIFLQWHYDCNFSATFSDRMKEIGRLQTIKPNARNSRSFSKASIATLREHRFSRSALHINLPPVNNTGSASGNNLNTLVVRTLAIKLIHHFFYTCSIFYTVLSLL